MDETNGDEKYRVLIVDSDAETILTLTEMLKQDYGVSFVRDGAGAIRRVIEEKPDLILLDVALPDMSGFDLLLLLKEQDDARDIPVIFITGLASVEDEEQSLRLGAVDYITKPFNNSVVRARVGTHLKIVKQIRTIERLGMIDATTDIPNRRFFDMRIKEEWRRTYRRQAWLSMLMLDVDKFKNYNDTYGHPQGDLLLQFVGKTLITCLRRTSDMAARYGGDEFAVLLGDTDAAGAAVVAERIRSAIEAGRVPRTGANGSVVETSITVSIGINALVPNLDAEMADFVQGADQNLYIAKDTGRNRVVG